MEKTDFNITILSNVSDHIATSKTFNFMDLVIKFRWHMYVTVYPVVSFIGLVGNIICIVVLIKSGLKKPSNALLTSLCVADSFVLFSNINIPFLMSFIPRKRPYYVSACEFPEQVCSILTYLAISIQFFQPYGENVSASLVSFITVERFIAVFYPLYFNQIITTPRICAVIFLTYAIWIPWPAYYSTLYGFLYKYVPEWDVNLGVITLNINDVTLFMSRSLIIPMGLYIPFSVVAVGSLLIALRVKTSIKKRQKIVSSTTKSKLNSSKSTKILLTVCAVFLITKIPQVVWNMDFVFSIDEVGTGIYFLLLLAIILMQALNSASNFIIYVALNKKFRKIFKSVMKC